MSLSNSDIIGALAGMHHFKLHPEEKRELVTLFRMHFSWLTLAPLIGSANLHLRFLVHVCENLTALRGFIKWFRKYMDLKTPNMFNEGQEHEQPLVEFEQKAFIFAPADDYECGILLGFLLCRRVRLELLAKKKLASKKKIVLSSVSNE